MAASFSRSCTRLFLRQLLLAGDTNVLPTQLHVTVDDDLTRRAV